MLSAYQERLDKGVKTANIDRELDPGIYHYMNKRNYFKEYISPNLFIVVMLVIL